jgi:hypothetical protein
VTPEVGLEHQERPLGRPGAGRRLDEPVGRAAPQVGECQALVDQVVEHRRQVRRGAGPEPHPDRRGARRDDLDRRTGQRADQLRAAADRDVQLDAAGGQVPLPVRLVAGALDPDRAHHAREAGQRRAFDVRIHPRHPKQPRLTGNRKALALTSTKSCKRRQQPLPPKPVIRGHLQSARESAILICPDSVQQICKC